jgi:hypothetical protein
VVLEWLGLAAIASRTKRGVNGLRLFQNMNCSPDIGWSLSALTIAIAVNDTISYHMQIGKTSFHLNTEGRCQDLDVSLSFFSLPWLCNTHFCADEYVETNPDPVSVFLPVRWIEFSSDDQIVPGKPGYDEKICRELESDREKFQYFLKFVEEQGAPLSEERCVFGWQKELDPHDDRRPVCFPLPTQCLHTVTHVYLYLVAVLGLMSPFQSSNHRVTWRSCTL